MEAIKKRLPEYVLTSWLGGARKIMSTNWSVLPKHSEILLAPNNDDCGRKAMLKLGNYFVEYGHSRVVWIDTSTIEKKGKLNNGGDLADLVKKDTRLNLRVWIAKHKQPVVFSESQDQEQRSLLEDLRITHHDIAREFISRNQHRLRYDDNRDVWVVFDGNLWKVQQSNKSIREEIRVFCIQLRQAKENQGLQKGLVYLGSADFYKKVEDLCRQDARVRVVEDIWDKNPHLLGTPEGIMDLRTGQYIAPEQAAECFVTKSTVCSPQANYKVDIWIDFLESILTDTDSADCDRGDAAQRGVDYETIDYLKQWCGYTLFGYTKKDVVLFLYGEGANGKTIFQDTISFVMGSYAVKTDVEYFMLSKASKTSIENFLATNQGVRLITFEETNEGRYWNIELLKDLTGGARIQARALYGKPYTYYPLCNYLGTSNTTPNLKALGTAEKRRFHILHLRRNFNKEIEDGNIERIKEGRTIEERIKDCAPYILYWMVQGSVEYFKKKKLYPSDYVKTCSQGYFDEQDILQRFIDEMCVMDKTNTHLMVTFKELYQAYSRWTAQQGITVHLRYNNFGKALESKGFKKDKNKRRNVIFLGINLQYSTV